MEIKIKSPCNASTIIKYGIKSWPIWECKPSIFQWNYSDKETCLIIQGEATIKTSKNKSYLIKAGDLVTFPKGINCMWEIHKQIRKHYRLGD